MCRSFGILAYARRMDSKETLQRLSDVRLGIDLGIIQGRVCRDSEGTDGDDATCLLTKVFTSEELSPVERDIRRAALIRERLRLDDTEVR